MRASFFQKFRRITYSTSYLPEIDGLRFLAIFSVVVIMHISYYLDEKFYNSGFIENSYWKNFVIEGGNGVPLFFIISGFILSLPFAKWRLNGERKVSLRNYYLRRVTRLEPPYVIALLLFFIANVWILNKYSFETLLPHFIASVFYLHTLVYHSFSWVLPIAWSLEVEVQFYVLAPLFFLIFLVRSAILRWVLNSAIIMISALYWFDVWNTAHVFKFLHYFFMGILLSDLYCCGITIIKNKYWGLVVGSLSIAGFLFTPSIHNLPGYLVKTACMFMLVHTVLSNAYMKRIFTIKSVVIIGGMCYSIYLLHLGIVSACGRLLQSRWSDHNNPSYFILLAVAFSVVVLIISAVFFLLVEKPFMRPMGLTTRRSR